MKLEKVKLSLRKELLELGWLREREKYEEVLFTYWAIVRTKRM